MSEENIKNLKIKSGFMRSSLSKKSSKQINRFAINHFSNIRIITKRNKTRLENENIIKDEEKELEIKRMKRILRHSSAYDLCINALFHIPSDRTIQLNNTISFYLKSLNKFMNLLSDVEGEELDKILFKISSHLIYEKYKKDEIVCKFGDKADKFYIILKGKVIFLVPKLNKHYLSEEEYIEYLLNLRQNGELELVQNVIIENQLIFYFGDDFDDYILNCLERYEKNNENIYSKRIYHLFYNFKQFKENEKNIEQKNDNIREKINIEDYIKRTVIFSNNNPEYAKLKKKKLISIFEYEKTNILKDGDTFGSVGTKSKSNKRTATSVCFEDCHLGILNKEDYLNILEKINNKASDRLYEIIISKRIFTRLSKFVFVNKYIHMFHYIKYYKNDNIMNDSQKLNKLLILYKGEFTLSINKNIIELNELIIKVKKLRGKMMNISEESLKKDLPEINDNKLLLIQMKYPSNKSITDLIMKRQNYIISKVKDNLLLGYNYTIDPETNLPLFNVECSSNSALGYKVEDEMLKLIKEDKCLRKNPPEMAITQINIFLNRLLGLKKSIIDKIKNSENLDNKNIMEIVKNEIEEKTMESFANKNDRNTIVEEEKKYGIRRNESPKRIKNTASILFDFNQQIISSSNLGKNFRKKNAKTLSPLNKRIQTINNIRDINKKPSTNKDFFSLILKFKKNVLEKKKLLRKVQKQSHRFLLKENREIKQIQMNLNKLKTKDEYHDISNLFSKNPNAKKTIDTFKNKKDEDNVLDPILNKIRKQIKNNKIYNNNLIKKEKENNNEKDNKNESFNKLMKAFSNKTEININYKLGKDLENKKYLTNINIKNLTTKNKYSIPSIKREYNSIYRSTNISNTNKQSTSYSKNYNLTKISLNDINIPQNILFDNDEYQDIYYMAYLQYIK